MKKIFCILVSFFILIGCNQDGETPVNGEAQPINEELLHMQEKLSAAIEKIKDIEGIIETNVHNTRHELDRLHSEVQMLSHLIKNSNLFQIKQAYIKDVIITESETHLIVDFAEFVIDDTMPNGFRIDNDEVDYVKVRLDSDSGVFILDDVSLRYANVEELKIHLISHERLFNFHYAGEQLAAISEQYLP
ncbi:hypothetical protein DS745_08630 [Anaerobacillus alkaliphilus]|uniref:Uncharacterized protein n=1 Tax=Anaerobacillus alkaliphilus TaxID=1548597 RepID=A0A4Q0VV79_9BACI|nr:hypothetical protein [Anaerobacillus alkaliphilus]RXJ01891.1 hypothetical protein DS745_08630 [Anaerobacillus alkaliphilus]